MPLELGIAIGRRMAAGHIEHDWLILVPENHLSVRFISDLAGFDPKTHDGSVETVVSKVMVWLATRQDAVYVPQPSQVLAALPRVEDKKRELNAAWQGEIPWADLILTARECIPE
jgi:hypothetical protein